MKNLIVFFTILILASCGSGSDSNSKSQYEFQIQEIGGSGEVLCESGLKRFNSKEDLCASVLDEYNEGSCDRACAQLLYESSQCGDIGVTFSNYSCSNHYSSSSET